MTGCVQKLKSAEDCIALFGTVGCNGGFAKVKIQSNRKVTVFSKCQLLTASITGDGGKRVFGIGIQPGNTTSCIRLKVL